MSGAQLEGDSDETDQAAFSNSLNNRVTRSVPVFLMRNAYETSGGKDYARIAEF